MANFYESVVLQQLVEFVLQNVEQDEDGDYKLDFIGNKTDMLFITPEEMEQLQALADARALDITIYE